MKYKPSTGEIADDLRNLAADVQRKATLYPGPVASFLGEAGEEMDRLRRFEADALEAIRKIRGWREIGSDDILAAIEEICDRVLEDLEEPFL